MARSPIALSRGLAPTPPLLVLLATCAALVSGAASAAADAPEEAHGNTAPRLQINGGGALHVTTATPTIAGVCAPGGPNADGRISIVISGTPDAGGSASGIACAGATATGQGGWSCIVATGSYLITVQQHVGKDGERTVNTTTARLRVDLPVLRNEPEPPPAEPRPQAAPAPPPQAPKATPPRSATAPAPASAPEALEVLEWSFVLVDADGKPHRNAPLRAWQSFSAVASGLPEGA